MCQPTEWVTVRWFWDGHQGWTSLIVNQTRIFYGRHPMFRKQLRAGGKLVIGQEVDHFDDLKFDANQRFVGAVRNVRLNYVKSMTQSALVAMFGSSIATKNHFADIVGPIPVVELKVCAR